MLRRQVFPACDALGLKHVTWLTLRRTYSSWAHDKGVPGKVVAQLMDHAKVDTTLNVYTQVIDGALRTAVDKVGSEWFTIVHKSEMGAELTHLWPACSTASTAGTICKPLGRSRAGPYITGGPTNFGRFVEHYDVALNKLIDAQLARLS